LSLRARIVIKGLFAAVAALFLRCLAGCGRLAIDFLK
jgi:hypothetical protein